MRTGDLRVASGWSVPAKSFANICRSWYTYLHGLQETSTGSTRLHSLHQLFLCDCTSHNSLNM